VKSRLAFILVAWLEHLVQIHNSFGGLRWVAGPRHTECVLVVLNRFRKKLQRCVREEGKFGIRPLDQPRLSSSRAYLPQQAARRIRAEGWVLGKAISGVGSRSETTYGLTPDSFRLPTNFKPCYKELFSPDSTLKETLIIPFFERSVD
jgi:hypothetical protein